MLPQNVIPTLKKEKKKYHSLSKLDYLYETADAEKKREIISSMCPEKMTFDRFSVRTNQINEAARLIYSIDLGFSENKNRTNQNNSGLSYQVALPVQFSNLFLTDLKRLASIVT
jgi:hypothetical protein